MSGPIITGIILSLVAIIFVYISKWCKHVRPPEPKTAAHTLLNIYDLLAVLCTVLAFICAMVGIIDFVVSYLMKGIGT